MSLGQWRIGITAVALLVSVSGVAASTTAVTDKEAIQAIKDTLHEDSIKLLVAHNKISEIAINYYQRQAARQLEKTWMSFVGLKVAVAKYFDQNGPIAAVNEACYEAWSANIGLTLFVEQVVPDDFFRENKLIHSMVTLQQMIVVDDLNRICGGRFAFDWYRNFKFWMKK